MKSIVLTATMVILLVSVSSAPASSLTDRIEWIDQFGTPGFDLAGDVATDDSFTYVTGRVGFGALPGEVSAGGVDSFVRKYTPEGITVWTRQFGTAGFDGITKVVEQDGMVYLAGATTGIFPGQIQAGVVDMFVAAFDTDGNPLFTRQWGTTGFDRPVAVTADAFGVYVLGLTTGTFPGEVNEGGVDLFLASLTFEGDIVWARQFGTAEDDPAIFSLGGIAVDDSGIYASSSVAAALPGQTALGNPDAFVAKFDHDGTLLWTDQFGTRCTDLGTGLTLHDGYLTVVGSSGGDLVGGSPSARCTQQDPFTFFSAFVQLREPDGSVLWTRQFEGNGLIEGNRFSLPIDVASDADGIFLASEFLRPPTPDTLDPSCPITGTQEDTLVRAYDFAGNEQWTQIIGSTGRDNPGGISLLAESVQVVGSTDCVLAGEMNAGSVDAFVLQFTK